MIQKKPLALSLAVSLGTGVLAALLTKDAMEDYAFLDQPPLAPPGWVFPVVWTALFILMGVAAYLVWVENGPERKRMLTLYAVQLGFNFFWTILFFDLAWYGAALLWLVALWGLILATLLAFRKRNRTAGNLLIPYLAWVTFAAYLNAGVWYLNG